MLFYEILMAILIANWEYFLVKYMSKQLQFVTHAKKVLIKWLKIMNL
jgi:hypothetical protein